MTCHISIRLNADVVEYFKRSDESWQTRMEEALQTYPAYFLFGKSGYTEKRKFINQ